MADNTRVFTVKIAGADQVVKDGESMRKAIEALKSEYAKLLAQLKAVPPDSELFATLSVAIAETGKAINDLEAALDDNTDAVAAYGEAAGAAAVDVDALRVAAVATAEVMDTTADATGETAARMAELRRIIAENAEASADLADKLKSTATGTKAFDTLSASAAKLDNETTFAVASLKALQAGFKGVGKEGNTLAGVTLQVKALKKESAIASAERRAQIDDEIVKLGTLQKELKDDARERGDIDLFPPGTLDRANAQLRKLQGELDGAVVGSKEFVKIKKEFDQLNRFIEVNNQSLEDQRRLYTDLAASSASTLIGAAGLFQSLGVDSKEAEEAILRVQQAMALIETLRQAVDTIQLARRAAQIGAIKAENAALAENTAAEVANTGAKTAGAGAASVATKASGGLVGGIRAVSAALLANPIGLIITAVAALGLAFNELRKHFAPVAEAFNAMRDTVGGFFNAVIQGVKNGGPTLDFLKNIGLTLSTVLLPQVRLGIIAVKSLFALFEEGASASDTFVEGLNGLKQEFADLAAGASAFGDEVEKEAKRLAKLRELDLLEGLATTKEQAKQIRDAERGSRKSTEAARRADNVALLKDQRALAAERVRLEQRLTDAQIAIIQSGNIEKIKQIKGFVQASGELTSKATESIEAVAALTDKDAAVKAEAEAAFQDALAARVQRVADTAAIQEQQLEGVTTFANRRAALEKKARADLKALEIADQAGEFRDAGEFQRKKLALQIQFANNSTALAREEAAAQRDIAETSRQAELDALEFRKTALEKRGALTLDAELNIIKRTEELNTERIAREQTDIRALDAGRVERLKAAEAELTAARKFGNAERIAIAENGVAALAQQEEGLTKRLKELDNELTKVQQTGAEARFDAAEKQLEREAAARTRLIDLAKLELDIERQRTATRAGGRSAELAAATKELERQRGLAITLGDQSRLLRQEAELLTQQYAAQRAELEQQARQRREDLDKQREQLESTRQQIEAEQANKNNFTNQEDIDRLKEIAAKLAQIDAQEIDIQAKLGVDTTAINADEIAKKAELAGQSVRNAFEKTGRGLGDALKKGVADSFSTAALSAFDKDNPDATTEERASAQSEGEAQGKAYAEGFVNAAGQLGSKLLELQNVLTQNAIARYEEDAAFFQEQADNAEERLGELRSAAEDSAQFQLSLEQQIASARGANADALQTQLDAEANRRAGLQQQIRAQEREKARFERERQSAEAKAAELRRRQAVIQKALAIGQAVIDTAGAVVAALKLQPVIPVGVAAAAVVGALGAAQIATIVAQPIQAAAGGVLTDEGGLIRHAEGGVVQGPSHASGGVRGTGRFNNIEVEGGEPILSRRTYALNRPVIDTLLERGHVSTLRPDDLKQRLFADGGIIDTFRNIDTAPLNVRADVIDNIRANNAAAQVGAQRSEIAAQADRPIIVSVSDINAGQARVGVIDQHGDPFGGA